MANGDTNGTNKWTRTSSSFLTFDWRISVGNLIAIAMMLGTVLIFYVKATAHIDDRQLHLPLMEKESLIDDRVKLQLAPIEAKLAAQHAEVMRSLARLEVEISLHQQKEK